MSKSVMIDGIEYVRADEAKKEVIIQCGDSLSKVLVGKFVLVRSSNAGINAGTVVAADETGIILQNARRIWYHKPADKRLSWYEGVVVSGLSKDSKVSGTVPEKVIIEKYEALLCNDFAQKSIMGLDPNEQN